MECTVLCFKDTLDKPPPIGSIITVKHSGCHSNGLLKRPVFWREKIPDSEWTKETVLFNPDAHKAFFESLSSKLNILKPSDWYNVRKEDIYAQGGKRLLQKYHEDSLPKVQP